MKWLFLITTLTCLWLVQGADESTELKPSGSDSVLEPALQVEEEQVPLQDQAQRKRGVIDPISESGDQDLKAQRKRGILGKIPSYSHGHDYHTVRHSFLKPFIVSYPVQSVPIGIKIPVKNPGLIHFKYPAPSGTKSHFPHKSSGSKFHHFSIHNPIPLRPSIKPGWPTTDCGHVQPTQHVHKPIPPTPVIPTSSVNVPVNIVPAPALTPVLPFPNPPVQFLRPLLPIHPPVFGPVPFAPVAPVAHVTPLAPVVPAPLPAPPIPVFHPKPLALPITPALIRPGHSLHTSYFATYPKYPFLNSFSAISPQIPVVGPHIAPVGIAPVGRFPLGIGHIAPEGFAPIGRIPFGIGHPLTVGRIPVARPPVVLNQVPLGASQFPVGIGNFPLNLGHTAGAGIVPSQTPLNVGQPPLFLRPGEQFPPFNTPVSSFAGINPSSVPASTPQTPLFLRPGEQFPPQGFSPENEQFPPFNPAINGASGFNPSQTPLSTGQPPFVLGAGEQFPPQSFAPENPNFQSFVPGPQDQGTNVLNAGQNPNVWMPMASPTPETTFPSNQFPSNQFPPNQFPSEQFPSNQFPSNQFPSNQFPSEQFPSNQFPSPFNPQSETPLAQQPQDINPTNQPNDQNQGYVYQQEGNQPFQDGREIQASLEQQAQHQFMNAQRFFSQQQQQQQQESGYQGDAQQQQAQQQYTQEQQQYQQQPQDQNVQQQQENIQQHSFQQFLDGQQQFISHQQQAAANPQHEPQLPQALPSHPLSGRPVSQAFQGERRQKRRRLRRPPQNEGENP